MDRYLISPARVVVVGKPSAELAESIAADEAKLVERTRAELGEERLAQLRAQLEAAIAKNETPIPDELLTAVPIPSLASVRPVPLLTCRGGGKEPLQVVEHLEGCAVQ